jgi:hypothetical protein
MPASSSNARKKLNRTRSLVVAMICRARPSQQLGGRASARWGSGQWASCQHVRRSPSVPRLRLTLFRTGSYGAGPLTPCKPGV